MAIYEDFILNAMERVDDVIVISQVRKIKLRVVSHLVRALIPISVQLQPRPLPCPQIGAIGMLGAKHMTTNEIKQS